MSAIGQRLYGRHPGGRVAFSSANLRGLRDYGRKHGVSLVELGGCISGDGLYTVTYDNGVTCKGSFADQSVMLGFFVNWGVVPRIDCCRTTFNKGATLGRLRLKFMTPLDRLGVAQWLGPWEYYAYRDAEAGHTPMVRFTRIR